MSFLKQEQLIHYMILCATTMMFFGFGLFHLAQFETTDEHLWKYQRIPNYWHAIAQRDWQATYINDKPGITVALFSGIGLIFDPHPQDQYPADYTPSPLFDRYDPQKTLHTNFIFRLPVLIVSTLSLYGFYLLIRAPFGKRTALLFTLLLATNPILLGMAQIINPDSFFWIFGGLALCAYMALVHTEQRKFLIACGIFTGFAFLSKYTAFTLVIFFILYDIGYALFPPASSEKRPHMQHLFIISKRIAIILLITCGIFTFFLPAVFSQPLLMFKGIMQFFTWKKTVFLFLCVSAIGMIYLFGKKFAVHFTETIHAKSYLILRVTLGLFLIVIGVTLFNVWTGQKFIPFDDLRDAVYANEPQSFNFKPFLTEDTKIIKKGKVFFLETYPILFSLTPIVLLTTLAGTMWSLRQRPRDNAYLPLAFAATIFFLCYFALTVMARVVVNVRYSIILYPILSLLSAFFLVHLSTLFKRPTRSLYMYAAFVLIIGWLTMWHMRPFYFSYTNFFLPQEFSIHDSWGHGAYEAAQSLNDLPNADQLIIWSNSDTVCRFFNGSCLRSRKIDLAKTTPDFFVISKRGAIKENNHFILLNNPQPTQDASYYFSHLHSLATWILEIGGRKDNYIVIIPYAK